MLKSILTTCAITFSTLSAQAGDFSNLNVLGFSSDGTIFAFEEYGVQDGSGFPYANRFYIDTASDSFISGSPVRVRIDSELATVSDARLDAKLQSEAIINDTDLMEGNLAGFNAVTEASADPFRMAVNPRPVEPPVDDEIEFRLTETQFALTGICADIGDTVTGFKLSMIGLTPSQTPRILHEDMSVPSSRNCPTGYRIGGVHTFYPDGGAPLYAIIIAIRSFGFEGPDYRWMAVTTKAMP